MYILASHCLASIFLGAPAHCHKEVSQTALDRDPSLLQHLLPEWKARMLPASCAY